MKHNQCAYSAQDQTNVGACANPDCDHHADEERTLCKDCGVDTTPCTGKRGCRHAGKWEWYMVHNPLWAQAGMADGYLCIGCLEKRIGRTLEAKDFTEAPINKSECPWNTDRLKDRLLGRGGAWPTPLKAPIAERPRYPFFVENNLNKSDSCRPPNELLKTGPKPKRAKSPLTGKLAWEKVNEVTWKLAHKEKSIETPRSHGQWPGYRTSLAIAWVINIGWTADRAAWIGRCHDKRGNWCLGSTSFDEARRETLNWALGLPVGGMADEWFLANPATEINQIERRLMRADVELGGRQNG